MTTKAAEKIAKGFNKGLLDGELLHACAALNLTEKDANDVTNAYRQIKWDAEDDLVGPVVKETPKPVAKKKTAKKTTFKELKGKVEKISKKPAAKKAAKPKKQGTDARLRTLILEGLSNEAALAKVKKEFPNSKTSLACASWNRSQLRNNPTKYGVAKSVKVPSDREAKEKK